MAAKDNGTLEIPESTGAGATPIYMPPPPTQPETQRDRDRRALWCEVVKIWFGRNFNIENAIGHAGVAVKHFDAAFPAK